MFIGLVGKSCSGKNYVEDILHKQGYVVLDLDKLCHSLLEKVEVISSVVQAFGPEVFQNETQKISRQALAKVIYENPSKRKDLENILYPKLKDEILAIKASLNPNKTIFLNGALLRRARLDELCTAIIYVDAPYEVRLERALVRDSITEEIFEKREAAQGDVDFRDNEYKAPVWIVSNGKDIKEPELVRQINGICDRINSISQEGNENHEEE